MRKMLHKHNLIKTEQRIIVWWELERCTKTQFSKFVRNWNFKKKKNFPKKRNPSFIVKDDHFWFPAKFVFFLRKIAHCVLFQFRLGFSISYCVCHVSNCRWKCAMCVISGCKLGWLHLWQKKSKKKRKDWFFLRVIELGLY